MAMDKMEDNNGKVSIVTMLMTPMSLKHMEMSTTVSLILGKGTETQHTIFKIAISEIKPFSTKTLTLTMPTRITTIPRTLNPTQTLIPHRPRTTTPHTHKHKGTTCTPRLTQTPPTSPTTSTNNTNLPRHTPRASPRAKSTLTRMRPISSPSPPATILSPAINSPIIGSQSWRGWGRHTLG